MPWSQDRWADALRFAAEAHHGQTVPGTALPYVVHVTLVAMEVAASLAAEPAERPDLAVQCALLHDTIEDTPTSFDDLVARFGLDVAEGVLALTKDAALPKAERMADSLRRIRERPPEIARVKLADRITNLAPPPSHWTRERCAAYRDEAQAILDALGHASPFLAARLRARHAAYARIT